MISKGRWAIAMIFAIAACESDRSPGGGGVHGGGDSGIGSDVARTDASDAGQMDAMGGDAEPTDNGMMAVQVPDPPTTPANSWDDVEPNDTAGQAVPVGQLAGALWMGFGAVPSKIASNTDSDWYVFRTGDATSLMNTAGLLVCSNDGMALFKLYLYSVTNQMLGPQLKESMTNSGCETLATPAEVPTLLMPQSVYALEIRPIPGLELGARTGEYGA